MSGFATSYSSFDRFQQRHRSIGFPLAVLQKYADDQGGYHAAAITYYGFFALFPLLLVLTTVLGFVLQGNRHLERRIVDSALGQFPVIGPQLSHGSLHGSALALGLGLLVALCSHLALDQDTLNHTPAVSGEEWKPVGPPVEAWEPMIPRVLTEPEKTLVRLLAPSATEREIGRLRANGRCICGCYFIRFARDIATTYCSGDA